MYGLLLPLLLAASAPRVVSLSSSAHTRASFNFDDLQMENGYTGYKAYSQTKLAMLVYARELQRQNDLHGGNLTSVAAHPGLSTTAIARNMSAPARLAISMVFRILGQNEVQGALPQLYAATASVPDQVQPGGYYGPDGSYELKGYPASAFVSAEGQEPMNGRQLWNISERLTGVLYPWPAEKK